MTSTALVLKDKCNNSSRKARREEVAEDIDGKRLNITFCQFFFLEKWVITSLETEGEKEVNCLKFEINHITESVGIEGEALSKIRKVFAYK